MTNDDDLWQMALEILEFFAPDMVDDYFDVDGNGSSTFMPEEIRATKTLILEIIKRWIT